MSKFIDRLTHASQATAQPMGFRAAQSAAAKPGMQLVAALTDGGADLAKGADAGLLRVSQVSSGAGAIKKTTKAMPDIPWGAWLEGDACGQLGDAAELGCDFVVFPAVGTMLAVPASDDVGLVLQVDSSVPDGQFRTANDLPVDAVLVTGEEGGPGSLTWHDLMLWRRFCGLLSKPLLVCVPANVTTGELQLLCDAGVGGVLVAIGPDSPDGELKRLREAIDELKPPSPRKGRRPDAVLPRVEQSPEPAVDIDEEDEDE